jgi:hypothetical protein
MYESTVADAASHSTAHGYTGCCARKTGNSAMSSPGLSNREFHGVSPRF